MEGQTVDDIERVLNFIYTLGKVFRTFNIAPFFCGLLGTDYKGGVLQTKVDSEGRDILYNQDAFHLNVEMYHHADYFQMATLTELSLHKFKCSAEKLFKLKSTKTLMKVPGDIDACMLKLIFAMETAYTTKWTPYRHDLRDAISFAIAGHMVELMQIQEFKDMVRDRAPAIAGDVFMEMFKHNIDIKQLPASRQCVNFSGGRANFCGAINDMLVLKRGCIKCWEQD